LHAVLCAAGFNIRWLLRAIARKGLFAAFVFMLWLASMLFGPSIANPPLFGGNGK
jgi:IS5 family transposase